MAERKTRTYDLFVEDFMGALVLVDRGIVLEEKTCQYVQHIVPPVVKAALLRNLGLLVNSTLPTNKPESITVSWGLFEQEGSTVASMSGHMVLQAGFAQVGRLVRTSLTPERHHSGLYGYPSHGITYSVDVHEKTTTIKWAHDEKLAKVLALFRYSVDTDTTEGWDYTTIRRSSLEQLRFKVERTCKVLMAIMDGAKPFKLRLLPDTPGIRSWPTTVRLRTVKALWRLTPNQLGVVKAALEGSEGPLLAKPESMVEIALLVNPLATIEPVNG